MGMDPAIKFFTDVKERFWIKRGAAPYGGSSTLGQIWEGNNTTKRESSWEKYRLQRRTYRGETGDRTQRFRRPDLTWSTRA